MKCSSVFPYLLGLLALTSARPVWAQAEVALDRYQPSPAGDALFSLPDANAASEPRLSVKVDVSYARAPLVLIREGDGSSESSRIVSHQLISHQLLSFSLLSRLTLDLDLPVTWSQAGTSSSVQGLAAPDKMTLNDLRVGGRLTLLQQAGWLPSAAVTSSLFLPTGDETQFSGAGRFRYALGVAVGADFEQGLWRAFVERRRDEDGGSTLQALLGSSIVYGAGVAWKAGPLQIGPELFGATRTNEVVDDSPTTNLEALLGARYRVGWLVFGAAAGPGLTRAAGTPSYRVLGSIALSPPEQRAPARASEVGPVARLPGAEAPSREGAKVAGKSGGVAASERGATASVARPDADADGIADQDDQCPQAAGPASADPARFGCPPDTDGDGIVDTLDACVAEKGPATAEPATNGCPKAVRVEGKQIVILQQVTFRTGSDVIDDSSFDLLQQIAHVLDEHPEIARLGVDGHTDDVGSTAKNLALSRRRAVAVVRWLVEHGVDERRLEARGFGPRRPLAANSSAEARSKNRRVEFTIVKRTTRGAEGWVDGGADE